MSQKKQLYYLMQISGGTFPSGSFSQSWGLETYVAQGKISNEAGFRDFMETYMESMLAGCEGPVLCEAYRLSQQWEEKKIDELEELSCAVRLTKESRESSLKMGKSFLRIMAEVMNDDKIKELKSRYGAVGISYPVAYGAVCGRSDIALRDSVDAFVFSSVNALVQSAVKLVPLGNTQAQKILMNLYPMMEKTADEIMEIPVEAISNFCPGIDIAGIMHEYLPARLYMS